MGLLLFDFTLLTVYFPGLLLLCFIRLQHPQMRFDIHNTDTHVMHRCYAIVGARNEGMTEASL